MTMTAPSISRSTPLRIHPRNPKLLEFRGKPCTLLCATEHYGSAMNRRFRFEKYLRHCAKTGQNYTRLFTLFRELQTDRNPYSSGKPESPDYICPFARVGPKSALDGQPKYNLAMWNEEFFDRLHRFMTLASQCDVVVELVLLSNTYNEGVWALNPLNPANNINAVEPFDWTDYITMRQPAVFKWQCAYVRKIVEETNCYDNLFYEICNEPGGLYPNKPGSAPLHEVNAWQQEIARVIRDTEKELPHRHLIAGQEAFSWSPFEQMADKSFHDFPLDIVNIHPLPNTTFNGKHYEMGEFMMRELRLRDVRDFALATYGEMRPLNYDEDNAATQYKDIDGWTIHRKRAWTALFSGAHYGMIDFSIWPYLEAGTPESRKYLRSWFQHLGKFFHSMDLVRASPLIGWLYVDLPEVVESVFAVEGENYAIYLADGRESSDSGSGQPLQPRITFTLPVGQFTVSYYSPVAGTDSRITTLQGGGQYEIDVHSFIHDIVIQIYRS